MSTAGCGNFVFPVVPDVTTQNTTGIFSTTGTLEILTRFLWYNVKGGCGNFVFPVVPDFTTQNRERDLYFQFQFSTAHFHHYFAISPDLSSFKTEGKGLIYTRKDEF